jgi:hypothetical protein
MTAWLLSQRSVFGASFFLPSPIPARNIEHFPLAHTHDAAFACCDIIHPFIHYYSSYNSYILSLTCPYDQSDNCGTFRIPRAFTAHNHTHGVPNQAFASIAQGT